MPKNMVGHFCQRNSQSSTDSPFQTEIEAPQTVKVRDPDIVERAYIAAKAYHTIRRYFAHAEGLPAEYDFEAQYRAYLQAAISAEDRRAFSLASMRLFASLRNGHTSFVDDQLREEMGPRSFRIQLIGGQWTVVWTRVTALSPGDVIVKIDGKPVVEWFAPV